MKAKMGWLDEVVGISADEVFSVDLVRESDVHVSRLCIVGCA